MDLNNLKLQISDMEMGLDSYGQWHNAIITNNIDVIKQILGELDLQEKKKYLNGHFSSTEQNVDTIAGRCLGHSTFTQCQRPLTLAFVFGSKETIAAMLENGADHMITETNGDTILHSITSVAHSYPDSEAELSNTYTYFMSLLSSDQQRELLHTENVLGLRPLEDAARQGCITLLRSIFKTPHVYLTKESTSGMLLHQWYDITDYESFSNNNRRGKSPLGFLAFMTNDTVEKDGVNELLHWTPFQHWSKIKFYSNIPWLATWGLYRIVLCLLTMTLMIDKNIIQNQGGVPQNQANLYPNATFYYCPDYTHASFGNYLPYVGGLACICGIAGLLYDVCELVWILATRRPEFMRIQLKHGNVAVSFWFFRITQCIYLMALVVTTVRIVRNISTPIDHSSDIGRLVFILMAFCSLLFFLQQFRAIGFYIIAIKRMLKDLLYFCVLYVLCVTPFVLYFMMFVNTNSVNGCISEFSDYLTSFYSMFMVMLNMVNFTYYDLKNAWIIYASHVIYIFMVAILLVNFLIAVMSDSAARIAKRKQILIRLEKLHALFIADYRVSWIMKRYYNYILQRIAVVQDDRIYVIHVQKNNAQ